MAKKNIIKTLLMIMSFIAIILAVVESESMVMFAISKILAVSILVAAVKLAVISEKKGLIRIDE